MTPKWIWAWGSICLFACSSCSAKAPDEASAETTQGQRTSEAVSAEDEAAFARLGSTFVESKELNSGGKIFYAQPKPYGSWLCRIDVVSLPAWIINERQKTRSEYWQDDVEVRTEFAAWRSPSENAAIEREDACRQFRNFNSLFSADGVDGPERYIFLLDRLLRDLQGNQARYTTICNDKRPMDGEVNCEPRQVLQDISIFSSFSAQTNASREVTGGRHWSDTLTFDLGRQDDHPVILTIDFEAVQTYGEQSMSEADIQSAKIEIEIL